jgi:hypothetical protein
MVAGALFEKLFNLTLKSTILQYGCQGANFNIALNSTILQYGG